MRKTQKLLVGLASLTLFDISMAVAADLPVKAPVRVAAPPPVIYDWAGFYVGAHGGYRWADVNFSSPAYVCCGGIPFPARNESYRPNGGIFGVQAGVNVMLSPSFLTGLEGDWSWGRGKDSLATTITGSATDGFTFRGLSEVKLTWQATFRGRLGVVNGPWLFYGTGGVAFIHAKWSESASLVCCDAPGATVVAWTASKTLTGWTVGGGIEYMLASNWIGRIEYLYENFGKFSVSHGIGPKTGTLDIDNVHKLRVALSYKFR